jgi:hypothetical protein
VSDGDALADGDPVAALGVGEEAGGVGVQFGTVGIGNEHAARTARTSRLSTPYAHRRRWSGPTLTP